MNAWAQNDLAINFLCRTLANQAVNHQVWRLAAKGKYFNSDVMILIAACTLLEETEFEEQISLASGHVDDRRPKNVCSLQNRNSRPSCSGEAMDLAANLSS